MEAFTDALAGAFVDVLAAGVLAAAALAFGAGRLADEADGLGVSALAGAGFDARGDERGAGPREALARDSWPLGVRWETGRGAGRRWPTLRERWPWPFPGRTVPANSNSMVAAPESAAR